MNLLIIEDEPRAANQLKTQLKAIAFNYNLLDIIDSVEDAVKWFDNNPRPDLIFMDIQLADGLSFEIFQKVELKVPIIFTTAFDQYAIQAFKVNSIDYLLKPIQKDDLMAAMQKFNDSRAQNIISPQVLNQLLASTQGSNYREGILVKDGIGYMQLSINDVLYIYSEDGISLAINAARRFVIDETIDQIFSTLNPRSFFRINRGQIINKMAIERFEPYFNNRLKIKVKNSRDQEFIVSRLKTKEFKNWMNQ